MTYLFRINYVLFRSGDAEGSRNPWVIKFHGVRGADLSGEALLLTVAVFLLTVELLCLQPLKARINRTVPL